MAEIAGFGALLHTEVERVDLGTHYGRVLRGRVEHRTLRVTAGRQWHASLLLGRRRAVAVEVTEGDHRYDVSLRSPRHALPVLRVVFMAVATLGLVLARRHRTGRDT
jgi:hypothetical protein